MFGLFKKQSKAEKMRKQYEKLLQEAFELSKRDRKASDEKQAAAEALLKEVEALEANQ